MKIIYTGEKDTRLYKNVIGEVAMKIIETDPDAVWLDADLMGCSGTAGCMKKSDRFINVGIAEANMIGIAGGMSAVGFKPYTHTFGCFASRRVFDQAFLSGGYAKNPMTIIGTDPGITAAFNGGTHMPFEDMALYSVMPEATVIDITDIAMITDILWKVKDMPGVKYIRVPRKNPETVYADGTEFQIGKGNVLREGKDATIVACGIMVHEAMQAAKMLAEEGIEASVIDMFTVKPIDEELLKEYATKTGVVVTAENHNKYGGLFSAVKMALNGEAKVGYVAVEDVFGEVGPQDYLRTQFDLTAEHIVREVKKLVAEK